jgi:hypothetical protein
MMRIRPGICRIACLLLSLPGHAQEPARNIQFSAFGTLGLAGTDTHLVGFRRDSSQFDGATDKPTANVDSRLGVQVSAKLGDSLLATLQVVSKYNYAGNYQPVPTWACLNWNPVSNFTLAAGYLSYELLPNGDRADVGYTYPYVRPPVEVYGMTGITRLRGVDAAQTLVLIPGTTLQLMGYLGQSVEKTSGGASVGTWDLSGGLTWAASATVQTGSFRGRAQYTYFKVPHNFGGTVPGLQTLLEVLGSELNQPGLASVANALNVKGTIGRSLQIGGAWEKGPYQIQGTLWHVTSDFVSIPTTNSGFVMFGYRVGEVVPYGLFARSVSHPNPVPNMGNLGSLPAQDGILAYLGALAANGVAEGVTSIDTNQNTFSTGLRWDFARNADLKFQLDWIRAHNSTALMVNFDPALGAQWNGKATVMSIALDFVFGGGR